MKNAPVCMVMLLLLSPFATGQQQYNLLYSFGTNGGSNDAVYPNAGLVFDKVGNLYGTTYIGGPNTGGMSGCPCGCRAVFELSPSTTGNWALCSTTSVQP